MVAYGLCESKYRKRRSGERRQERLKAREDRTCAWCEQPIPAERRSGVVFCSPKCKQHAGNFRRQMDGSNTRRTRHYNWANRFGITVEDYERMLAEQDGRCAICRSSEPGGRCTTFPVDHNHDTGEVRSLLCGPCNTGLGQFKDDVERLKAAMQYLIKYDPSA